MRIYINILFSCICSACTTDKMVELWNSGPDTSSMNKKIEMLYNNESLEKKMLRQKNQSICDGIAKSKFSSREVFDDNTIKMREKEFVICMKEKGTPIYNYSDLKMK